MKTFYIPLFPWFYDSVLSSLLDSEQENLCNEYGVKDCEELDEKIVIDWKATHEKTAKEFLNLFTEKLGDELDEKTGIKIKGFSRLVSPRFYNYSTDEIEAFYEIDEKKAIEFLKANKEKFSQYIKDENTSYDWFIAYFQNDFEEYIESELEPWKVTQIIDFYILLEDEAGAKYMNNPIIDEIIMELCPSLEYTEKTPAPNL